MENTVKSEESNLDKEGTVKSKVIKYTKKAWAANELMGLSYMLALPSETTITSACEMDLVSSILRLKPSFIHTSTGIVVIPSSNPLENFDPEPELNMRREWFAKNATGKYSKRPEDDLDLKNRFRAYSKANYQVDFTSIVKAKCDFFYVPYHHSFFDFGDEDVRVNFSDGLNLGSYSPMFGVFVARDLANTGNFHLVRASLMYHKLASMENIRTNIRDIFCDSYNKVMPLLEEEFAKSDEVAFRTMNHILNNISKFEFARLNALKVAPKIEIFTEDKDLANIVQVKLDMVNKALEHGLDFDEVRAMMTKVFC